jgi:hypothetical protein
MKNLILILVALSLFGCTKESSNTNSTTERSKEPRYFKIGEKFAGGIVIGFKEISHNDFGPKNIGLQIIGLNDFTNLNFRESLNKIQTIKDEYGDWNFQSLDFRSNSLAGGESPIHIYNKIVEDSLIKNNGTVLEKSFFYWQNGYTSGKPIVQSVNITLGTTNLYKSSDDSLSKNRIRPTRLVVFYNTPLKKFKVGQEYNYGSLIFSIDSINRKIKIFKGASNSEFMNWEKCNTVVKESTYDGGYGFRLPTVEEIKIIATQTTLNIRCWTSTEDPSNSKNAFSFEILGNPQVRSREKIEYIAYSVIIGVKEIDY